MALTHQEVSRLGGQAIGRKKHQEALERYYQNPNYCQWCGEVIHPKTEQSRATCEARRKKFCNSSCAASFNNTLDPKRKAHGQKECERCGKIIFLQKSKRGGYNKRRFCDTCLSLVRSESAKKRIRQRSQTWDRPIELYTKQELRDKSPNYNYFGSYIGKHARKVYTRSEKPLVCTHCGYSYHVDVCHMKDISKFNGDALIGEINDLSNLVALCKNHHREFDDGVLKIE
jgi:hypothetical protein